MTCDGSGRKTSTHKEIDMDSTLPGTWGRTAKAAVLSPCGRDRYRLSRIWGDGPPVNFVMLNPSTADHEVDDPTIRRCVGFAKAWAYGGLVVTNLFPYRATSPKDLFKAIDRHGPDGTPCINREHIQDVARSAGLIVCAWGTHADPNIAAVTCRLLRESNPAGLHSLKLTKHGLPSHPLYLPLGCAPTPWVPR